MADRKPYGSSQTSDVVSEVKLSKAILKPTFGRKLIEFEGMTIKMKNTSNDVFHFSVNRIGFHFPIEIHGLFCVSIFHRFCPKINTDAQFGFSFHENFIALLEN